MRSIFYYSHELARYDFGPDHPFKPERAEKTLDLCRRYGVFDLPHMAVKNPPPLEYEELLLAHSEEYLQALRRVGQGEIFPEMLTYGIGTEDNPPLRGIYDWSLRCAGATRDGIVEILNNGIDIAFNPLGGFHHALRAQASGFCYINDIVVAIKEAPNYKVKVTYVDIDAHHGDGVQKAFYHDERVQFVSLHESGKYIYPYTGFEENN